MKKIVCQKTLSPALQRYRLVTGVTLATAVTTPGVQGAIVFFDNSHSFTVNSGTVWDVDGITADFVIINRPKGTSSTVAAIYARQVSSKNGWVIPASLSSEHLKPLLANQMVGAGVLPAGARFQPGSADGVFTARSNVFAALSAGTQFIGFQFMGTGQVDYGWANITLGPNSLTFNNWAYENTGAAITVGATGVAVPEPANSAVGLGLLALGAAGVSAYKRKKKLAAA